MKGAHHPEDATYVDTGCDLHPRCLSCPFPECRYDSAESPRFNARDETIRAAAATGNTAEQLATRFGLSQRSIWRILTGRRA